MRAAGAGRFRVRALQVRGWGSKGRVCVSFGWFEPKLISQICLAAAGAVSSSAEHNMCGLWIERIVP